MNGAQALIESLKREGVDHIFGYAGATICPAVDALREVPEIGYTLVRTEQNAGHMASGYARVSGKVGVCMVTSGPGATNLITGIATAYMDSIPMVAITGQVPSHLLGRDIFQEVDITGAVAPFSKHSYLVKDPDQIPRIVREAFHIASTGRPGPVLIDIPIDVQEQTLKTFDWPEKVEIRGYKPSVRGNDLQIKRVTEAIAKSRQPIICAGGGVWSANAQKELLELAEGAQIPVVKTMMGISLMPTDHPLNMGMIGAHGNHCANKALAKSDLLIMVGTRAADRAIVQPDEIQRRMPIIHIDVDPADFVNLPEGDKAALAAAIDKYPKLRAAVDALPPDQQEGFVVQVITENFSFEHSNKNGVAIWSDVATMMPWAVYENYGDLHQLRAEYPVMKTWVERMRQDDLADGGRGLWLRGHQLGDWLALDKPDPKDAENPFGATDLQYTASCFYFYSASLTAKAAKALGYEEDAADYRALSEKIRGAVVAEYFNPDGSFKIEGTQTACVLSLFFGIYPEGKADRVLDQLKARLKAKNWHLDTGFCGTPFLCRALSDHGANDIAYTLFLNDDFPSWLYEVKLGATTVWERWNSLLPDGSISGTGMNSLNHYAYGSIVDWMYRNLCGFNPVEEAPGYKRAVIRPMPDPRLRRAEMTMDTAAGLYRVSWRYEGEALRYGVTVPFDCTAQLILPDGRVEHLEAGEYAF